MPLQLGLGLNRLGGFNPFTPNHLNPYLLFDTRTSMLGELESPTLDLDPAVPSSLDVITATRSGVATYTDINGTIQTADPNTVRVDYTQGEELTPTVYQRTRFTDFSNGWLNSGVSTVANTESFQGQVAKRFTVTGNGVYYAFTPVETGQEYTASFYARLISGSPSYLYFFNNGSDLVYTPISVTSEWQRFTTTVTSTGTSINSGIINTTGTEPVVVEISQPQFEEGTTATTFVPNTTGSPKFIASATYSPRVPMMLIEPSATNLVDYSEDFSQPWIPSGVSVLGGQPSPSGSQTATLLKGNTNSSRHNIVRGGLINTVTASFSLFAKAKELRYLQIASANSTAQVVNVDLLSGTIGNVGLNFSNVVLEPYPDGWFRITLVSPNQYNAFYISLVSSLTAGWLESWAMPNDTDGLYIWGAQLEEGSVATSYIPTSGSAVQRAADNLVIDGSAFTDFYNDAEGTIYTEFEYDSQPNFDYLYTIQQTGNDEIRANLIPTNTARVTYVVAGSNVGFVSSNPLTKGSLNRHAFSYKTDNFKLSVNGGAEDTDLTGTASLSPTYIQFGARYGSVTIPLYFKRFIYWPTHSDSL